MSSLCATLKFDKIPSKTVVKLFKTFNKYKYTHFFIINIFISNASLNLAKNQANAKQHPKLKFRYLKIIEILYPRYPSKIKNKRLCIHEIIRLIILKMKMKMENVSNRYDINRPRPRHGNKYSKYK